MTTKGEAIAIGIAAMSTVELTTCDHGVVAKIKRCIMERDTYPRRWGMGPVAVEKKKMKSEGKLDKYGRANENTPAKWNAEYKEFSENNQADPTAAVAEDAETALKQPTGEQTRRQHVMNAPAIPPVTSNGPANTVKDEASNTKEESKVKVEQALEEAVNGDKSSKKKRKRDGETEEERKARKAEKKAKRKSKEATAGAEESD